MKNEKYSHKDYSRQDLKEVDPKEFNDNEIVNGCFAQKEPFTECFPVGIVGVTFDNCNLDNCIVPKDNTVKGGTNKQLKEQADGEIWIVDDKLEPITPLKPWRFDEWGLSKDPKDIVKQAEERLIFSATKKYSITQTKDRKQVLALKELIADKEKLLTILKTEGKI